MARASLVSFVLAGAACGPELGAELPPSGIYDTEVVTLGNTCRPVPDVNGVSKDIVVVEHGSITLGAVHLLSGLQVDCDGCDNPTSYERLRFRLDEDGRYSYSDDLSEWWESEQCSRRRQAELEVLDEQTLRTRVTQEWADAGGGCPQAPLPGCSVVREYTFTLDEACDDCMLTPVSP